MKLVIKEIDEAKKAQKSLSEFLTGAKSVKPKVSEVVVLREKLKASLKENRKLVSLIEDLLKPKLSLDVSTISFRNDTISSLTKRYDISFFDDYEEETRFRLASKLCNWCETNGTKPVDLWQTLVNTNGNL